MTGRIRWLESLLVHAVLLGATAFALYPVLWVLSLATSGAPWLEPRLWPWPVDPTLTRFVEVVGPSPDGRWLFGRQLAGSLLVSGATALVCLVLATPAAYAMSRFDFVGRGLTERTLLATQMFPGVAAAVPLYLLLDALGLIDTRTGLVLAYATSAVPFALFQLRATFDAIPRELDEAALVDGASRPVAFWRVVLPAARPGLAVTALFAFLTAWNEFALAATFLSAEERFTLPVVLHRYAAEHGARWDLFAAGAVLVSVPPMILFYWLQRHLVSGWTAGAIKG
ncbi:MAG: carbohydrate ABC transporter permease [Myxococcota bacterium]|nr:carbohydrate ABC transporter permease [Myxococcota bacterium]MDW8362965.1 carbohydrate ABC transporter permease [Myxococcales bacterium]